MVLLLQKFFLAWVAGEPSASQLVRDFRGDVEVRDKALLFTLPAIFDLLQLGAQGSYLAFRRALYQSDLNTQLLSKAYRIDIARQHSHVDRTLYRLAPITPP
jgi:hypothetical protein